MQIDPYTTLGALNTSVNYKPHAFVAQKWYMLKSTMTNVDHTIFGLLSLTGSSECGVMLGAILLQARCHPAKRHIPQDMDTLHT